MGDVAELRAGVDRDRLIRIDAQRREERRVRVLLAESTTAAGAFEWLRQRGSLAQREREDLARGRFRPFFSEDALHEGVFDRVADDRKVRRIDGVEADDVALVLYVRGVEVAEARLDDVFET